MDLKHWGFVVLKWIIAITCGFLIDVIYVYYYPDGTYDLEVWFWSSILMYLTINAIINVAKIKAQPPESTE